MGGASTGTLGPLSGFICSSSFAYVCNRKGGRKNCERVSSGDARRKRFLSGRIALRHPFQKTDDVAVYYLRRRDVRSAAFRIWLLAYGEHRLASSVPL